MSVWSSVFESNIISYGKIICNYLYSIGWEKITIGDYLKISERMKLNEAIQSKYYEKKGEFPIVSQSKDLISGYTNDESLVNQIEKPVVIFGDHTQVIKYIDFDFALGADGTQIITANEDYLPKFLFYILKSINLNSNKYARHFSKLKKHEIPHKKDELEIQERIESFLNDLYSNQLESFYFDETVEKKILALHNFTVDQQNLFSENQNQSSYLTKLRQAILQEAIEGKLTADWRKENPVRKGDPDFDAEALLEKIQAEKEKLIKEGKIKKQKPLAPIKAEEVPFELPEGWVWTRLGGISSIVRGGSPRPAGSKQYYDGDIPFLKVADLTADSSIYLHTHTYTIKKAGLYKTRYVDADTLMLTNSGATLGIPKICKFPTTFNDGIAAFLGLSDALDKIFLFYFLKSKSSWFLAEAARGQGQPNLNTDIIGNTIIALPPTSEQQIITDRVEKLLSMVDELEKQVSERKEQSEQLMQAVLWEAFEGGK